MMGGRMQSHPFDTLIQVHSSSSIIIPIIQGHVFPHINPRGMTTKALMLEDDLRTSCWSGLVTKEGTLPQSRAL